MIIIHFIECKTIFELNVDLKMGEKLDFAPNLEISGNELTCQLHHEIA